MYVLLYVCICRFVFNEYRKKIMYKQIILDVVKRAIEHTLEYYEML